MSKFCDYCENLLKVAFYNDELVFECFSCKVKYPPKDVDSLRYEINKTPDINIFAKILNKVADDPAAYKIYKKCTKDSCSGNIVKQVPIGVDMHLYNVCTTCKTSWLN